MVGENITFEKLKCTDKKGENIFSIDELYVKDIEDQYFKVKGISLNIKAGEIVGLAGVDWKWSERAHKSNYRIE